MKRVVFVVALATITSAAHAQQPAFTPYTITAQEHQALMNYLGDVPAKYANPLINQLGQMEQNAQRQAQLAGVKKPIQQSKPDLPKSTDEPKK